MSMTLEEFNAEADKRAALALEQFNAAVGDKFKPMSLLTNPSAAAEKFKGPLMTMVSAIELKNQVVTHLVKQNKALIAEFERRQSQFDSRIEKLEGYQ